MEKPPADLQQRIASALGINARDVEIDRFRPNDRRSEYHSWGNARQERFFAKTLVQDPFHLTTPISAPPASRASRSFTRPAEAQIEREWDFLHRFLTAAGPDHVCTPLGVSAGAKTIVWKEIDGENLRGLVAKSRWIDPDGRSASRALAESGAWLRTAQASSVAGSETVEIPALITLVADCAVESGVRPVRYAKHANMATRLLEAAFTKLDGAGQLTVPVALSHGDFSLSNLVWSRRERCCFVVDFEHAAYRPQWHDPVVLISNLRLKLLNPLVPARVVESAERAFWEGYGPVPSDFRELVTALASAWVLYAALPWFAEARRRRGWFRGIPVSLYGVFIERFMVPRRLPQSDGKPLTARATAPSR